MQAHKDLDAYVITELISTTDINYVVGAIKTISGDLNQKVKNTDETISATKDDKGNWTLIAQYTQPHYIFYKASRITKLNGLAHPTIVLEDQEKPLRWKSEANR